MAQNKELRMTYLIVVVFLCVLGVFGVPTVKTHKSLETSQKHPERIKTQRQ